MGQGEGAADSAAGLCLHNTREHMRLYFTPIPPPLSLGSLQFLFPTQTEDLAVKVRCKMEKGSWYPPVGTREDWCPSVVSVPEPAERLTGFSAAHSTPPSPDFSLPGPNSLLLQDPGPLRDRPPSLPFQIAS